MSSSTNWFAVALWFVISAIASTYSNTAFLKEFHGDAIALTLIRFMGSALLGAFSNVLPSDNRLDFDGFADVSTIFVVPALCLLAANLFNSISLDKGGITLTYVVKAGIPLVTRVSSKIGATLIPTVIGVALSAWADTEFAWEGFIAAWISTISQALLNVTSKTSIAKSKLTGEKAQFVLVTIASVTMLIANVAFDFVHWDTILERCRKSDRSLAILVAAAVSYHVEYVLNFIVTENVSEVHFSVLDVARRLSIILAGALMFGKTLTPLNIFGVLLALTGVLLFSRIKRKEAIEAAAMAAVQEQDVAVDDDDKGGALKKKNQLTSTGCCLL